MSAQNREDYWLAPKTALNQTYLNKSENEPSLEDWAELRRTPSQTVPASKGIPAARIERLIACLGQLWLSPNAHRRRITKQDQLDSRGSQNPVRVRRQFHDTRDFTHWPALRDVPTQTRFQSGRTQVTPKEVSAPGRFFY